jgi:excinuclease ABC subunit C
MGDSPDSPRQLVPVDGAIGPESAPGARFAAGAAVIAFTLATIPSGAGVYRMINSAGDVLYVGKAKSLKKRVSSYTNLARLSIRLGRMVAETASMEFLTTHTEAEALLLEANLIKRFQPRYNILLRDDKSFPSILLTNDHPYPRVLKHRGARRRKGEYFGPFASGWAVNETLTILQRAFLLRSCSDSIFAGRTRPCLLYQIKRCSAPCVGRIKDSDYTALVDQARAFLASGSQDIQRRLARRMEEASQALDFEEAAQYRDRIRALSRIQAHQDINLSGVGAADVIAAHQDGGQTCIQVFFFRSGRNYGNHAYYPSHTPEDDAPKVLAAFIGQFYDARPPPRLVLLSHPVEDRALITEALGVRAGHKVAVHTPKRGNKRNLVAHALVNAREALGRRMAQSASQRRLLDGLVRVLDLSATPERIEVYDNSHISGSQAMGAMIVAGTEGFLKGAYRKFTIGGGSRRGHSEIPAGGGDDIAMMREMLTRRFARALKEGPSRGQWPDLVLIDGGAGQLGVALEVFADLGIEDVAVAAIAKGPHRNGGHERLFLPERDPFTLPPRDPVLYFLQRLRDEAHRFAIGAHRAQRTKGMSRSALDTVPGIGAKRKKALLHHFGSAPAVAQAGRADLEAVTGISTAIANKIYDWFHPDG